MSLLHTDWPTAPLGRLASINERALAETTDPDYTFRYLDISSVGRGEIVEELATIRFENAPSRARRILRRGDTIVSTVRTYLRAVLPIRDEASDLIASTGFAVLSPGADIDSRFLSWYAQSDPFIEEVVARSVGVSYPAIAPSELAQFPVPTPALAEQRAIADFLDAETTRIDALIAKKRRLAKLMIQRFRAEVDSVLGRVSEQVPVRRVISRLTSGPRGWASHVADDGAAFLTIANVQREDVELNLSKVVRVDAPDNAEAQRTRAHEGDIVLSITADIGSVGIVRDGLGETYVSQHLALLTPDRCVPDWLAFALWSSVAQRQLDSARYGGTKTQLALQDVADVRVALPEHSEQLRLVQTLRDTRRRCLMTIEKLEKQITLLAEHRQALITAAVTGRIEVPGVAIP